jgi:alanyl-tRNA synthetase
VTARLYLSDPYLVRFAARVTAERTHQGKPAVVLDRSAFYPEGGGQPADQGRIAGVGVVDVQEVEGELVHVLAAHLVTGPGTEVEGELDWHRRFDHMQQHHGQHLLSAAFEKILGAPTVSFHLGEKICTIDLDCTVSKLDDPALRAVEAAVNESVRKDLPVVARDFVGEERAKLPLRKEPVKGDRVVFVDGVDASPCGGTHPKRTGEVGAVAILRAQKWGEGKSRVEFVCGGRVLAELASARAELAKATAAARCSPAELPEFIARLLEDGTARKKALEARETEIAKLLAEKLDQGKDPTVVRAEGGVPFAKSLAAALAARGRVALVAAVGEGRVNLCFARPKGPGPNLGEALREAVALVGGKGGGSPDLAQGSGPDLTRLDAALSLAESRLTAKGATP